MAKKLGTLAAVAAIAAGGLVLSACSGGSSAETAKPAANEATKLTVGITPIANAASLYVALDQGYFKDEGLEVTPNIIQTAATAIPSLLNNELQFALMTAVPTVTAASKGLPIKVVAGSDRYPVDGEHDTTALVVSPESGAQSVADLAGKTVALVGLKSAPELALRVVLEDAGVKPDSVKLVEIAYPDMVSALKANRVDAAFIVDPFLSAAKAAGLKAISQPFTDGLGDMSALLWVTSDAFVKANPTTALKFAKAMHKAGVYANEHPDAIREVLPKFTKLSPEAIAKSILPEYDEKGVTAKDIKAYVDLMTREGFIDKGFDSNGLLWSK